MQEPTTQIKLVNCLCGKQPAIREGRSRAAVVCLDKDCVVGAVNSDVAPDADPQVRRDQAAVRWNAQLGVRG